jgi:hypothetical protein
MSNTTISLSGKVFKAEPNGDFIVSRKQLRGKDLRSLPPGTTIAVSDFRVHRNDPICILSIQGPGVPGFDARFDYWRCPHCWGEALQYSKFMDAALELLKQAATVGIMYEDSIDANDGTHHILHMIRPEYRIEDMEVALEIEVDNVLDQLIQFTIQLNQQVKQQFNV